MNSAFFSQQLTVLRVPLCIERGRKGASLIQIAISKRQTEASLEGMKPLWRFLVQHTCEMSVCLRCAFSVDLLGGCQPSKGRRVLCAGCALLPDSVGLDQVELYARWRTCEQRLDRVLGNGLCLGRFWRSAEDSIANGNAKKTRPMIENARRMPAPAAANRSAQHGTSSNMTRT